MVRTVLARMARHTCRASLRAWRDLIRAEAATCKAVLAARLTKVMRLCTAEWAKKAAEARRIGTSGMRLAARMDKWAANRYLREWREVAVARKEAWAKEEAAKREEARLLAIAGRAQLNVMCRGLHATLEHSRDAARTAGLREQGASLDRGGSPAADKSRSMWVGSAAAGGAGGR